MTTATPEIMSSGYVYVELKFTQIIRELDDASADTELDKLVDYMQKSGWQPCVVESQGGLKTLFKKAV
jgi:hypothetical protein